MTLKDFTIGMRVVAIRDYNQYPESTKAGEIGVVCHIMPPTVGVRWETFHPDRHNCQGHCEKGHGWHVKPDMIRPIEEEDLQPSGLDPLELLKGDDAI